MNEKILGAVFSATLVSTAGFLPVSDVQAKPTGCYESATLNNRTMSSTCTRGPGEYCLKLTCVRTQLFQKNKYKVIYGPWVMVPAESRAKCPALYRPDKGETEHKFIII
jgi:hypothetical protein